MRARAVVAKLARLVKATAVVSLTWEERIFQWGCCHVLEQLLQEVKASEKDLRARKDAAQMALDSMVTLFSFSCNRSALSSPQHNHLVNAKP